MSLLQVIVQYLMDRFADRGPSLRPSTPELRAKVGVTAMAHGGCEAAESSMRASDLKGHGPSARPRIGSGRRVKLRVRD